MKDEEREPGDICPRCLGDGFQSKWTVGVICPDCDGSGKQSRAVEIILSGENEQDEDFPNGGF